MAIFNWLYALINIIARKVDCAQSELRSKYTEPIKLAEQFLKKMR